MTKITKKYNRYHSFISDVNESLPCISIHKSCGMKINLRFSIAIAALLFALLIPVLAQDKGEAAFKQTCAACHTIGKGKLVGPDLASVHTRRPEEWIKNFVRSSQTVIKSGDKYADSLFKAFNQIPMPDNPGLTDENIKDILNYIAANSPPGQSASPSVTPVSSDQAPTAVSADAVNKGKHLFIGNTRFVNGGSTCNSCHNVEKLGIISGGALAKDLTDIPTRMDYQATKAMISGMLSGIPAMQQSFKDKSLTEDEIASLAAFLSSPAETQPVVAVREANIMLWSGITGVVALLFLFPFFWAKRKQRTVNYAIYKRQIKST